MKNQFHFHYPFLYQFLNHLCDEEHTSYAANKAAAFLNHLCDEEHDGVLVAIAGEFLNHLCDEELPFYFRKWN